MSKETNIALTNYGQKSAEILISKAIDKGVSVETMERLLAMRRELKKEFAEEAFNKAMANFQAGCPVIEKLKEGGKTKSGIVAYMFAPLEYIVSKTKELRKENGFSHFFDTVSANGMVKVSCTATHELGHSKISSMEVPSTGGTEIMSGPQKVAAAITFAKRYAFCDVFGIVVGGEDNDAQLGAEEIEKRNEDFRKLSKAISTFSKAQLKEYGVKVEKSKRYTPEQKAEIKSLIAVRTSELK